MYRLTCFLLILLPLIVIASDELSGLEGIEYVVVITGEDEDGDLIIAGVLNSIVQSQIELALRRAGITVKDSMETILDDAGVLRLSLNYICEDFGFIENLYVVNANLTFTQLSYVSRDLIDILLYADENPNADVSELFFNNVSAVWAVTWQMYQMYYCGQSEVYDMTKETIDRLTTVFANDYLKANQK